MMQGTTSLKNKLWLYLGNICTAINFDIVARTPSWGNLSYQGYLESRAVIFVWTYRTLLLEESISSWYQNTMLALITMVDNLHQETSICPFKYLTGLQSITHNAHLITVQTGPRTC